jgi:acetylornithine deacetylase/succinyl-diaminopimelate desuccinylase-like protein
MTRTEKLLAELIALPSVNPAFAMQSAVGTRGPRVRTDGSASRPYLCYGEKNVADFLATVAARAGLEVEFQKVSPVESKGWGETPGEPVLAGGHSGSRGRSPHQTEETGLARYNVIARLLPPGKIRQTILLAPHLDTVGAEDSQFVPRRKNGRLYGRGACDTKGSVAAMLTALCELANAKSRPQETEIVFAGLVDEENAQAGSRALAASGFKADLAIVGEPTRLQVVTAHKGSLWLQLETRGWAAHGATPQLGQNAVHKMARIVDLLETDYAARLRRRRHPLLGTATVNVGMISGGTQPNIVPDRCVITLDRRTLPGETESGVRREIAELLCAKKLPAKISSTKLAPCLPLETNPKLPLVRHFLRSAGQRRPAGVDFFCDAAVLAAGGIPSVVFGPGDIAQAHTADEWISLDSLERGKNLLLNFLKSLP